jgi:hypothetical protein
MDHAAGYEPEPEWTGFAWEPLTALGGGIGLLLALGGCYAWWRWKVGAPRWAR